MNTETNTSVETTTPATETTTAAAPKRAKISYPFVTKTELAIQLQNYDFCCIAMQIMLRRQTETEQERGTTINKNRAGFMSSHAVHGTRIAKALRNGEEINPEDRARIMAIAPRYTRQLAEHYRDITLQSDPELAKTAAVFGL